MFTALAFFMYVTSSDFSPASVSSRRFWPFFALPLAPILFDISLPFSAFSHVSWSCLTPCFRAIQSVAEPSKDTSAAASSGQLGIACKVLVDAKSAANSHNGAPGADGISPLSLLLSNILLNELERRGHLFVCYPDDANIYVCSRRAGERVVAQC